MLRQNGNKALKRAVDRTMDNDGSGHAAILAGLVLELEAQRKLEVELHSGTLPFSPQCIFDTDVDLWAVKRTIAFIEGPWVSRCIQSFLQRLFQHQHPGIARTRHQNRYPRTTSTNTRDPHHFSSVPHGDLAQELLGTSRQRQLELKPKHAVHELNEIENTGDFFLQLQQIQRDVSPPTSRTRRGVHSLTWSSGQKMCASSCWNRRTRVRPERAPENSLRCSTPKSAHRRGNSR